MALVYNPKDVFIVQRNDAATNFVETILRSTPNSVVMFDSGSTITTLSTTSFAENIASASLANFTASVALLAYTASFVPGAETASYLKPGANIYLSQSYIYSDINASEAPQQEGILFWDKFDHTYEIWTDKTGVSIDIGQKNVIRVSAGEVILKGKLVYLSGSTLTGLPIAHLAIADSTGLHSNVAGMCDQDLATSDEGFVVSSGRVENLNTFLLDSGDTIYLTNGSSGDYQSTPPSDPYEKVIVGYVLTSDPTTGIIQIHISTLPSLNSPYVGMIEVPSFTDNHNQTFTVGSARGNFCTTPDGLGQIKTYTIPQASFTASIGTLAQYILGIYNSGSPVYSFTNDKSLIDEIQTIPVFSTIAPVSGVNFADWDAAGTLLANKLHLKTIQIDGAQRASGLVLGVSGSYITLTSGSLWYGVKEQTLSAINTSNTASFPLSFYSHTTGSWNTTAISSGQFINGQYDDGTNLQTLASGSYVINYIYRTFSNRIILTLSDQFTNLNWAEIASPPIPPSYFPDFTILVGRIIVQSGSATPYQVNSLFDQIPFPPSEPPYHNGLQGLQGGSGSNEFYHLSSASFAKVSAGSLDSASYLIPGATLYVVSGSTNGPQSSYIEPYNIPVDPYNPPFKEGRMFYDSDFHNWVYYPEQNFKLHIGKEVIFRVHNPFPTTLTTTTVVYISGSTSGLNLPDVYPAQADGTGLHASPVGIIRSDIPSGSNGYVLTNGVIHNIDASAFQIGDTLWLSSTTPGGLQNFEPGSPSEQVRIGTVQQNGAINGSYFVRIITVPSAAGQYAGMISPIVLTNNNNGSFTVSTGSVNLFSDPTGLGSVVSYPLGASTFTPLLRTTQYLHAFYQTGSAGYLLTTDDTTANETTEVRVATIVLAPTGSNYLLKPVVVGEFGLALANKTNDRDIQLYGFQRENGFALSVTESRYIDITGGRIWYGAVNHDIGDYSSLDTQSLLVFMYHSASVYIADNSGHQYNSSQYDDGTQLNTISSSYYVTNYIFRLFGGTEDAGFIIGNQYADLSSASLDLTVPAVPLTFSQTGILVGRIIIQSGSDTPALVDSAFATTFTAAPITDHNSLSGLQGGTGGQYYHLTLADFTGTGTGVMVRQSGGQLTASLQGTASNATTSSFAQNSVSSSFAVKSTTADTASFLPLGTYQVTSSWANNTFATTLFTGSTYQITASQANTSSIALFTNTFAGIITDILLVDNGDGSATISSASVNLFSDPDGNSIVTSYFLPSASFPIASGSANYIIINYNAGSPIYQITTDPSIINQTTIIPVSVISNIRGEIRGYNFDNQASALANRIVDRLAKTEKFTRQSGLTLFNTGSYIGITQGTIWDEATQISEVDFNSAYFNGGSPLGQVNENYFYHHTSSLPAGQFIVEEGTTASNQWVSNYYDNGTDLVPMSSSWYVVNYVWRLVGGVSPDEDASSIVGTQWQTLNEAKAEEVPNAPTDITELGVLVGRAILQSGSSTPVLIESAFATTFVAAAVTNHEALDGLEGGQTSQHYHLTAAEYTGTGTGVFVRTSSPTINNATGSITTASFATFAQNTNATTLFTASTYPITSSWSITSSYALGPATTLFTASTYPITSSWSVFSVNANSATTASLALSVKTASFAINAGNALTASYLIGAPQIKSGVVAGASFTGAPRIATVTFTSSFIDNNYSVTVTGESSRTWTIQSKTSGSFVINSNNNGAIANNTFWQAIAVGEFGS